MFRFLNIILVSVLFLSCNRATIDLEGFEASEGSIELIGKWRLVDWEIERITNNPDVSIDELPESAYRKDDILLEFFANGKVLMSYAYPDEDENGNEVIAYLEIEAKYTLSADKKTLTITNEEGTVDHAIIKLDANSLVYRVKEKIEVCVIDNGIENCEVLEEYWSTLYFAKVK